MAEHNLFFGGDAPATVDQRRAMLPGKEPRRDDASFEVASHNGPTRFSITRRLDFLGCKVFKDKRPIYEAGGDFPKPVWNQKEQEFGSQALEQYLRNLEEPIAVGDVLNVIALPNRCVIDYIRLEVARNVAGATFDIDIRNGTVDTNTPIPIGAVDGGDGTVNEVIFLDPRHYTAEYNDMLRLTVTGMPANPASLCELALQIDLVIDSPCGGFY